MKHRPNNMLFPSVFGFECLAIAKILLFLDDESSSLVPVFFSVVVAEISTFLQYVNCHIIAAVCCLSKSHCKIM